MVEVVRDRENDRRLQAGRDRLANIDIARDHDAIDRRRDRAVVEIRFRLIERALFDFHVGFRLMKIRHGLIEVRLGGILLGKEILRAFRVYLRKLQRGLCVGQIAFGLSDRCLKERRIDLRDHLAGFHLRIKIGKQLCDIPRDLAAHLHVHDGIERARRGHCLCNRAARDSCGLIICSRRRCGIGRTTEATMSSSDDEGDPREKTFHSSGS